jgi:hypothetical protein
MGTYGLEGVISAWEREKLTPDQAIGQLLQLMQEMGKRIGDLERRVSRANNGRERPTWEKGQGARGKYDGQ